MPLVKSKLTLILSDQEVKEAIVFWARHVSGLEAKPEDVKFEIQAVSDQMDRYSHHTFKSAVVDNVTLISKDNKGS